MKRSRFWLPSLGLMIGLVCGVILARFIGLDFGGPAQPPRVTPGEDRALMAAGLAYAEVEKWEQALERFDQYVKLHPENLPARLNLGITMRQAGQFDEALGLFDGIFEALPAELQAEIEFQRSLIAYERGQTNEEATLINGAIELGNRPIHIFSKAQFLMRSGSDEGERLFLLEKVYDAWPENTRIAAELAQSLLVQASTQKRALLLLDELTFRVASDQMRRLVKEGARELEVDNTRPVSLWKALNVLRSTKRFQNDSSHTESLLRGPPIDPFPQTGIAARQAFGQQNLEFEKQDLLPDLPYIDAADGESILEVKVVDDAKPDVSVAGREAGIAVLTSRRLLFLARDAIAWQVLTEAIRGRAMILVGDLDSDRRTEIVVSDETGIRIFDRDEALMWSPWKRVPELSATTLRNALIIDFEHDGDLDVLAIDDKGGLILLTNRGHGGFGEWIEAPLPLSGVFDVVESCDFDNDADQDLVLVSNDRLHLLRNIRQGEFGLYNDLIFDEPVDGVVPLDYDGDAHSDLALVSGGRVILLHGDGSGGFKIDAIAGGGMAELSEVQQTRRVRAVDLDLDGDLDLVAVGRTLGAGASSVMALENGGARRFLLASNLLPAASTTLNGVEAIDLDANHSFDLVLFGDGRLTTLANGLQNGRWLVLRIEVPDGKAPLDGHGVRLVIRGEGGSQSFEMRRPTQIVGLGPFEAAVVTATWPDGICTYKLEPEAMTTHRLELALGLEGSCPYLYADDGEGFRFITDVLGLSPLGVLIAPGVYHPADVDEYVRLPEWVHFDNSRLKLRLAEELREVTYLDHIELVAVDAPTDVEVYNGEQWIMPAVEGLSLRLLSSLRPPVSVLNDDFCEVVSKVALEDEVYLTNHKETSHLYLGVVNTHSLVIELPSDIEHPALMLVGWLQWGSTSTNLARAQDPLGAPVMPYLEVPDGDGWRRLPVNFGLPSGKTKPIVIDLGDSIDPHDPRVRLTTDFEVYWDRIAVAELLDLSETQHHVQYVNIVESQLDFAGFSRLYQTVNNGPGLFDYQDRLPYPWRLDTWGAVVPLTWQELEGALTPYGDVHDLLTGIDDRMVVFGSGEEIAISFDTGRLQPLKEGWRRTFFLHFEGWEKDGDPNVACSQTVDPLPYRGMKDYPCPGTVDIPPAEQDPPRSRWVERDRLERRLEAILAGELQ